MTTDKKAFTLRTDDETAHKLILIMNEMQLEEGHSVSSSACLTKVLQESVRGSGDKEVEAKLAAMREYYRLESGKDVPLKEILLRLIADWQSPAKPKRKRPTELEATNGA